MTNKKANRIRHLNSIENLKRKNMKSFIVFKYYNDTIGIPMKAISIERANELFFMIYKIRPHRIERDLF